MKRLFYVTLLLLVATIGWLVYREWTGQYRRPTEPSVVMDEQPLPATEPSPAVHEDAPLVPAIATEERDPEVAATGQPTAAALEPVEPIVEAPVQPPAAPTAAPVVVPADPLQLLANADALATAGDKPAARLAYIELLKAGYRGPREREIKDRLTQLNGEILLGSEMCPEAILYTVTEEDSKGLAAVARRYDTTHELIVRLNRKKSEMIRIGETLKIVPGPFDVLVSKKDFTLEVYLKGAFVKHYRIGLGMNGITPVGDYQVTSKLVKPVWFRPGGEVPYGDPENPLGTRWVGFFNEYGIHGTWEPDSIGKEGSRGCVRMLNADVEDLFDLLVTGKSKITIAP